MRVDEEDKCDPTISSVFGEAVYYRRDLTIYPNPTTGDITVKVPDLIGRAHLVVTDINSKIIIQLEINNSAIEELDLTSLPSGRYNVEIYPEDNTERIFYGRQVVKI
ncbi:MAG: T9SS type A sorting domain-containing protein [Saprospiraceae bacterium]|nr:T9SS type A sorting domain-containing protein [Saprospiraceae bacterium]